MGVFEKSQYIVQNGTGPWQTGSTITTAERDELLTAYWGATKKKFALISEEELTKLQNESSDGTKRVLVVVKNIDKPTSVEIAWHAYDPNIIEGPDNYYIISDKYFDGDNPVDEPNGIFGTTGDIIGATIAASKDQTQKGVIINQIDLVLVDKGGIHGDPPGVGVKIPAW
jgi:hypothetical protein